MADVFISYSRKDVAFARLLHKALQDSGLEAWIDWQDIPPSAEWLAEVYEAIEQAGTFVFILSQQSAASDICSLEISHAVNNNKRLIPVVIDEIEPSRVTPELAALNWLFFREHDEFSQAIQNLTTAIQTDFAWVKEHTRLQIRALEWERKERDAGYLLRGRDLDEAEKWLAQAQGKDPLPTTLQHDYLAVSRQVAKRRKRIAMVAIAASVAIIIAAALTVLFIQLDVGKQQNARQLSADLLQASANNDLVAAKKALGAGADVNAQQSGTGRTALHVAAGREMSALVLEAGADVNARDVSGMTPLHQAAANNSNDTLALLLEDGADVNARENFGATPLHFAALANATTTAAVLLEVGADVNARDDNGATPLQMAVLNGITNTAEILRQYGGVE